MGLEGLAAAQPSVSMLPADVWMPALPPCLQLRRAQPGNSLCAQLPAHELFVLAARTSVGGQQWHRLRLLCRLILPALPPSCPHAWLADGSRRANRRVVQSVR